MKSTLEESAIREGIGNWFTAFCRHKHGLMTPEEKKNYERYLADNEKRDAELQKERMR